MGVIINPRGTSGAGKTEFARRVMRDYGWPGGDRTEPVYRRDRARPIAYRLRHPSGGRPLAVLGHYEATSGGCDTIRLRDGGLDEVFRLADDYASAGHDVLLEGLVLSAEYHRSSMLARKHELHVLWLRTLPDRCVSNLIARRRARRAMWPLIARAIAAEQRTLEHACENLRPYASVEAVDFDDAILRAQSLLGLGMTLA
jgi:hypothetical protein